MRKLWKWTKRVILTLLIIIVLLASPVIYVETMCTGPGTPQKADSLIDPQHHRPESKTLMTYPEWHIVHAYEDYAETIRTGDPHEYGYASSIKGFWSSLCSLTAKSSELGEITPDTKLMVYVIGVSFSLELTLKAAYEETVGRLFTLFRGEDRSWLDRISAGQAYNYADFLEQTPWYRWDFREDSRELKAQSKGTLRDRERVVALGIEYGGKAAYADLIAKGVASTGYDELTLRMIVDNIDPSTLSDLPGVTVKRTIPEGVEIETPRYRELTRLMQKMASEGADFVEIAGNDDILITVIGIDSSLISDNPGGPNPKSMHTMKRQGFDDYRHLVLLKVSELGNVLRMLDNGIDQLEHIHDY